MNGERTAVDRAAAQGAPATAAGSPLAETARRLTEKDRYRRFEVGIPEGDGWIPAAQLLDRGFAAAWFERVAARSGDRRFAAGVLSRAYVSAVVLAWAFPVLAEARLPLSPLEGVRLHVGERSRVDGVALADPRVAVVAGDPAQGLPGISVLGSRDQLWDALAETLAGMEPLLERVREVSGLGLARALGRGGRPSGRQRALAGPAVRARPVGRLGRSDERHQPAGRQGAEAEGEAPAVPGAVARRGGAPHGAGHLLPPLPQGKGGAAGRGALLRELPAPPRRLAQGNDPGEPRRRGRVPVSVEKGGQVRRLEAASSAAPLRSSKARLAALAAAAVLLAAVAAAGLRFGSVPVTAADAFDALFRYSPESYEQTVVRFLRLPRTVIGLGAGAALAVAGAALQATTRNPLADPSILGVNAGAAFGVVVAVYFGQLAHPLQYVWFAFAGGLGAAAAVYAIGSTGPAGARR